MQGLVLLESLALVEAFCDAWGAQQSFAFALDLRELPRSELPPALRLPAAPAKGECDIWS